VQVLGQLDFVFHYQDAHGVYIGTARRAFSQFFSRPNARMPGAGRGLRICHPGVRMG
jgi:hypothetical protein